MSNFDLDRAMWVAIRAALLAFVDAIERRYGLGKHSRREAHLEEVKIEPI